MSKLRQTLEGYVDVDYTGLRITADGYIQGAAGAAPPADFQAAWLNKNLGTDMAFKKNTAVTGFTVGLVSATDGSDITTGTPVGYYTLDGGTQTAINDVTPVHEGNGQWSFDLLAAEFNGDVVGLTFTHTSAVTVHFVIATETKLTSELNDFDAANDAVANVTDVTNQVIADMTAISGDTTAADNLELMYDGTGYEAATGPSTQAQVSNLAVGSAAISTVAAGLGSAIVGTVVTGDYTDTFTLNQVYHQITDSGGNMTVDYEFNVGGAGVATEAVWIGRLTGDNDDMSVQAYNWVTTTWEGIGLIEGSNSSNDGEARFNLNLAHTGTTGANKGLARVRGIGTGLSSANFYMDQVYISYAIVAQSVGYANGAVWVDTTHGVAGSELYVNGTADNPCSTWADALLIGANLNLHRFHLSSETSITLTADSSAYEIIGAGSGVELNGQNITGTQFSYCTISGTGTGTSSPHFIECSLGTATLPAAILDRCGLAATVTCGSSGDYFLVDCFSQGSGSGSPIFDLNGVGSSNISVRRFGGGLRLQGLTTGDVVSAEATVGGSLNLDGTAGSVEVRGRWKQVVDNSSGALTIVVSKNPADVTSINGEEASAVNLAASTLGIVATTVTGTPTTTTLNLAAGSTVNEVYIGRLIVVTGGTYAGLPLNITDYIGSSKLVTFESVGLTLSSGDSVVIV